MVAELDDRELLARLLQAEAGSEGPLGMLAVGSVIRNRANARGYGDTIRDVMMKPGQFSPLNSITGYAGGEQGVNFDRLQASETAYAVADAILSGEYDDPTGGATHFYNPDISTPSWGRESGGDWMTLGRHIFGMADAGRDTYQAPTQSQATPEARRAQYGLGDRDPGTTAQVLQAVAAGDMTKSEAARFVSEDLLEGVTGSSAFDMLNKEEPEEEASFMDRLGDAAVGLDFAGVGQAPSMPSRLTRGSGVREGDSQAGTRALQRFGLESLVRPLV
jgi:hypothetical protein